MIRWSMGSALFLGSWAVLMGPMIYGEPALTQVLSFGTEVYADPVSSPPSRLARTVAVHSHILWQHCVDTVLRSWRKSIPICAHSPARTDMCTVTKYNPHPPSCHRAAGGSGVVPHQLLPYGIDGPALCCEIRHRSNWCVDEQLIAVYDIDIERNEASSQEIMVSYHFIIHEKR